MVLWIKDFNCPPTTGWLYRVPETGFEIHVRGYTNLYQAIVDYYESNRQTPPTQEQVVKWLCDNLLIECLDGKENYPNKFTRRFQPLPRDDWPFWAKALALLAKPGDKGIGDTVYRTIGSERSEVFEAWHLKTFGHRCGCSSRREGWNADYPLV